MKKTKNELFKELKALQNVSPFAPFTGLKHKAVDEAETLHELKQSLAFYYDKYDCLSRQQGRQVNGFEGAKFFLGEMYFTSEKACKGNLLQLRAIAFFMGYEIEKLTW